MPQAAPRGRLPEPALAFLLIIAVLGAFWPRAKVQPFNLFDQSFYIGIGYDLLHQGQFTNGFMFDPATGAARAPGMRFTPLYPALVAAAGALDAPFADGMTCLVQSRGKDAACPRRAPLVRGCQFVMLVGVYWLIWWMAGVVLPNPRGQWLSLALALLTAPELLNYVNYVMTEITALALFTATTAAVLQGLRAARRRPARFVVAWFAVAWFAVAGAGAGLTALTRPAFFYLFLLAVAAGVAAAACARQRRQMAAYVGVFALCGALVVGPWIVRNAVVMGDAGLTEGYGAHVLNERIAFDQMDWREYGLSFLCWLPDGNAEGAALFGAGACHRFQWGDQSDNFYRIGNGTLMQQSLAASGGWPLMFSYLLRTYILRHPFKHFMVTIPLALRGAWIANYWGLVLMPICLVMTARAAWRRDAGFLVVSLPAWFMLFFAAAISVNQTRYNLMLIAPFAIAGAALIDAAALRVAARMSARRRGGGG